jgi:hypothetical protein
MNVPTEDDWRSEVWSLDTEWAYKNFHGKTAEEAVPLFEESALIYQEDLTYMPSRVFGYYLKAYITYLMSAAARGDSDGASCFISLINFRIEHKRDDIIPLWPEIEPVLKKLAEHQDDFEAEWVIYGSFRARIHEIVRQGFNTSFDTTVPEIVPESVTLREMAFGVRIVPLPVAVQVFRNSGIDQIDSASRKPDILRVFGPPDNAGGGDHPKYGHVPDWIRYDRPDCVIRFEFDGDSISNVMFTPPIHSTGTSSADGRIAEQFTAGAEALAAWDALFETPPRNEGVKGDIGSKEDGL